MLQSMYSLLLSTFLLSIQNGLVQAIPRSGVVMLNAQSLRVLSATTSRNASVPTAALLARQTTSFMSTCGYLSGDPNKPRTANSGFDCRTDIARGLWGFCPTTVIEASDCGLAAACVDAHACNNGCGPLDDTSLTTFTW